MSEGPHAAGEELNADIGAQGGATSRIRFQLYILLVLAFPALFLVSSIPIVRSASFPTEAGDPFLLNPDYAFSLVHVDCDVVIYGDSTALTGLDPTVVSGETGYKTCNIAQARSVVEILGMKALDTYLQNNKPPKFIVMQFAPETLSRSKSGIFWPEGLTLLLRRQSLLAALPTLILHPVRAYEFSIWAIKAKLTYEFGSPPNFASSEAIFLSHGGLMILPKPAQTSCLNVTGYKEPSGEWTRMLKTKYSNKQTRVLINISPLPTCSPIAEQITAGSRQVTDNSPSFFPIGFFCDLDRHLTLEGATRASTELSTQLLTDANP